MHKKEGETEKMKMNALDLIAFILVIVGGLNWGLVGAADIDVVQLLLGSIPYAVQVVYILVGLAALYMLITGFTKMKGK